MYELNQEQWAGISGGGSAEVFQAGLILAGCFVVAQIFPLRDLFFSYSQYDPYKVDDPYFFPEIDFESTSSPANIEQ